MSLRDDIIDVLLTHFPYGYSAEAADEILALPAIQVALYLTDEIVTKEDIMTPPSYEGDGNKLLDMLAKSGMK